MAASTIEDNKGRYLVPDLRNDSTHAPAAPLSGGVRTFVTGATRDQDQNKYDYEGFLSPLVIERFGEYMHKHRLQSDGRLRDSDNWQKGIPLDAYIKSGWRHVMDWWQGHRELYSDGNRLEDALCAILFNVSGYLHELLKRRLICGS
jgi:hypothetical protein